MNNKRILASFFAFISLMAMSLTVAFAEEITPTSEDSQEVCGFQVPSEGSNYYAEVVSVRRKLKVDNEEVFRVKVFIRNTGNMPWFSIDSSCLGPKMFLGTDKTRDRDSSFYQAEIEGVEDTNWYAPNRIKMDQLRIDPGEIASFTFWSKATSDSDVVKEYFTPILKDIEWIDDARFSFEVIMGDVDESPVDLRKKMSFAVNSGSVLDINLNGEKVAVVDLSEQRLYVYLDDNVVNEFPVSTGAAATPTPVGTTQITLKQEVRVGSKSPHYVMPKFQWFRAGGYGFHALPSLGNDGGLFWTEAREHIGIPVSHGCVRLLPEDADWLFDFTDIGTTVTVQY